MMYWDTLLRSWRSSRRSKRNRSAVLLDHVDGSTTKGYRDDSGQASVSWGKIYGSRKGAVSWTLGVGTACVFEHFALWGSRKRITAWRGGSGHVIWMAYGMSDVCMNYRVFSVLLGGTGEGRGGGYALLDTFWSYFSLGDASCPQSIERSEPHLARDRRF